MFWELANVQWMLTAATAIVIVRVTLKLFPFWKWYREMSSVMGNIDGDPPHWLFGHIKTFAPNKESFDSYCKLLHKFPKCQPMWLGPFNIYLQGYHPEFMKAILSTDEPKDEVAYRFLRPWIGDGLLTSHGAKWKRNRRLLTPAFHFENLKRYLECMNRSTVELLDAWQDRFLTSSKFLEVEMFQDVSRMTLDTILRCIMSKESGCQRDENNAYLQAVKRLSAGATKRLFNPIYFSDFIFYLTPTGRAYKQALKVAHDFTNSVIDERIHGTEQSDKNLDFLDILLKAKDHEWVGLSRQEICDEVATFVFEGHDTVSSGISWAMYNLAAYPHYQEKCRREVNEILNGRQNLEWGDLSKFCYLTRFIKESLRLSPPVFTIARKSSKPIEFSCEFDRDFYSCSSELSQQEFPPNSCFLIALYFLHRNPHV